MPDPTGPTDPTLSPDLRERLETISDALATSNRAAKRNREAIASLHTTIILLAIIAAGIYYTRGRVQ